MDATDKQRYEDYQKSARMMLERHKLRFRQAGKGGIIEGLPKPYRINSRKGQPGNKNKIRDNTPRSLRYLHWLLDVSPVKLDTMITLTFREKHENPKQCLRDWVQACPFGRRYGSEVPYVWVQEYQGRGVIHYHVAFREMDIMTFWHSPARLVTYKVKRKNGEWSERSVFQGGWADRMAKYWIHFVGDQSQEFSDFQMGGIVEPIRNPERAGYYLGRYLGKESQKMLPDGECPQGRWWYCHPAIYPELSEAFELADYSEHLPIHRFVHDYKSAEVVIGRILEPDKPRVTFDWLAYQTDEVDAFGDAIEETGVSGEIE